MYNVGEIKGFCPKACNVRPSSNLFSESNAITRAGFTMWHSARCPALRWWVGLHLYLAGRCSENPQSARGPTQCKSGPSNNMVASRSNHLLYHLPIKISSTLPVFTRKNTFKKISRGKMLIEQIIKVKWRGPGPPRHACTPITAYVHDKTKISTENLRVDHYLLLKYCRRQSALLSPIWAKSRTKFSTKM